MPRVKLSDKPTRGFLIFNGGKQMETERQPEHYEQLVLFDVEKVLGKLALNRWDDMGNYFEGDDRFITVFQHGHIERYGPLGDPRSIAEGDEW